MTMTPEQRDFILSHREKDRRSRHGIIFASDNARPLIEELLNMGYLEIWDAMREVNNGETATIFGRVVPIFTLYGSYALTDIANSELSGKP